MIAPPVQRRESDSANQHENQNDNQYSAEQPTGAITPTCAVRPGRNRSRPRKSKRRSDSPGPSPRLHRSKTNRDLNPRTKTPQSPLRHGNHVRGWRHGRRRHFRESLAQRYHRVLRENQRHSRDSNKDEIIPLCSPVPPVVERF